MESMISFERACELIDGVKIPAFWESEASAEVVAFNEALGRVLAQDVVASFNMPELPTAAMDGFALRGEDLENLRGGGLKIIGESKAGGAYERSLGEKECVRIYTGALLPPNANTLLIVEDGKVENGILFLGEKSALPTPKKFIRQVGQNYKKGDVMLAKGSVVDAFGVGLLADLNCAKVAVKKRPKVGIIITGDELVEVGEIATKKGQVRSVNNHLLAALVEQNYCQALVYKTQGDDFGAIEREFLNATRECDVVVLSGGMSMGEYDFTQKVLEKHARLVFKKVRLKPGKPVAFGVVGVDSKNGADSKIVTESSGADSKTTTESSGADSKSAIESKQTFIFGLPGFPNSCATTFLLFARRLIFRLLGTDASFTKLNAILLENIARADSRAEFRLCDIVVKDGEIYASTAKKGALQSSMINNFSGHTAFIYLCENGAPLAAGARVEILLFKGGL